MRRQVVDIPGEVRKIIAGRVAAGEAEDRFRFETRGELPEMWLDPDKMDQILGNLIENAVRHGAGTVTIVVEPDAHKEGAVVSVRDEGEGIPPEAVQRVFRQFWRGPGGNRRGGTGLGLYIVKGLVEAHCGVITVRRAPGGGAEFRFTVPAGAPTTPADRGARRGRAAHRVPGRASASRARFPDLHRPRTRLRASHADRSRSHHHVCTQQVL